MSEPRFLLDTGPLTAYLDPRDQYYPWASKTLSAIQAPLLTCETVLSEAFYLLSKTQNGVELLIAFCESGALHIDFHLLNNIKPVHELLRKYRDVPMDLADACLVHLADQHRDATLLTTDRDFLIYRTKSRRQIPLIAPFVLPDN